MNDDDELDDDFEDDETETPIYILDESTQILIETACNCIVSLAQAQINEESGSALMAIADEIARRFAIDSVELEEHTHETDEGEETLLAPKGGVFPDSPEEGEAPAAQAEK